MGFFGFGKKKEEKNKKGKEGIKVIDPKKLNTNALRDFLIEIGIVGKKINEVNGPLQLIYTSKPSNRKAGAFHKEGEVGVIVENLKDLKEILDSLSEKTVDVEEALLGSLQEVGKEG